MLWQKLLLPASISGVELMARHMSTVVSETLNVFRVVVLHGARQAGKSTLARQVAKERGGTYQTLDDKATLDAALDDPTCFLTAHPYPLVVDEIQLGGDRLVRAAKVLVDEHPVPGRFLFTGSTNFLTVPTISESLAGRAAILRLHPLSEAERHQAAPGAVQEWFNRDFRFARVSELARDDYMRRVCRGGYPETTNMNLAQRRHWFSSYVQTVTQRDLSALADIRQTGALEQMTLYAAAATSSELNIAQAASRLGVSRQTFTSYLDWLATVFLTQQVPAWSRSYLGRTVRRPKLYITDTGLAATLLGLDAPALSWQNSTMSGPLLESFVVSEITRQIDSSNALERVHYWRDRDGHEVDIVLERPSGEIVAVEVKSTGSPTGKMLRHMGWLRDKIDTIDPDTFRAGVLLHTGPQTLKIGDRLYLAPIDTLWRGHSDHTQPSP